MNLAAPSSETAPNPNFQPVVMAVDDEDSVRLSLRYTLKEAYPNLILCANSREALEAVRKQTVHVAILDIKMVGESGLDLLRTLKAHDPFIECIMLTAFDTQENIKEALRRGASEFLHKPPQMSALLDAVGKAVDARRSTERTKLAINREAALKSDLFVLQSGVIHDLRNQMTVISGMLALIDLRINERRVIDDRALEALRGELMAAQRAANVCVDITTRHLDLLRSASDAAPAASSVQQVIHGIADSLQFLPDAKRAACTIRPVPPDLPATEVPGILVFQLLLNIAINAAQARRPGTHKHEVTISVDLADRPLPLAQCVDTPSARWVGVKTFKNAAPFIRVAVKDNGTGIKPEVLGKMFVQNYSTKPSGTGLGLMLVGKLCTDNGVLLHVATELGAGTTTTIYLPTAAPGTPVHPGL